LLNYLAERDVAIVSMKLDKHKMLFSEDPLVLYSSMVLSLLNKVFIDGYLDTHEEVKFIASQMHTNKLQKNQFIAVMRDGAKGVDFEPEVARPADNKGLQAVDFVAWALGRKYEYGETTYADIIQEKILCEYDYI
jgi:hypothetical protein